MSDSSLPAKLSPTAVGPSRQGPPAPIETGGRWRMIRDLVVFQIKLVVDGLKDIVLGPLSLFAGIIDILRRNPPSQSLFRSVVRAGANFDRWVGLFDAVEEPSRPHLKDAKLEMQLRRLEQLLVAQQQRGGLTSTAKQAIDHTLDQLEAQLRGESAINGTRPAATPYSGP